MTSITSWIFENKQGKPKLRLYELPEDARWVLTKDRWAKKNFESKQPCFVHDGVLYFGKPEVIWTPGDEAPCTTNCKNARGMFCQCSCKGKNHGINNRDEIDSLDEDDIIYIGD